MKLRILTATMLALLACLTFTSLALADEMKMDHHAAKADKSAPTHEAAAAPLDMAYPLDYCIVSGEPLPDEAVMYSYKGREIRFCCTDCISKFEAHADDYIGKIDAAIIKQQVASYPLNKCMVTDEELGGMGEPVDIVVNNRLVRLCCGGCEEEIRSNPEKYIGMLDEAAIKAQLKSYPAKTCPISGEELGPLAVNAIYAGKLVRFCCEDCVKDFDKDPAKYMDMIYGGGAETHGASS